jgi:TPR repeat protein
MGNYLLFGKSVPESDWDDAKIIQMVMYISGIHTRNVCTLLLEYSGLYPWMYFLGRMAEKRGQMKDAFQMYQKAVEQHQCKEAMVKLAQFYLYSFGATRCDWHLAKTLLEQAKGARDVDFWIGVSRAERIGWSDTPEGMKRIHQDWKTNKHLEGCLLARVYILYYDVCLFNNRNAIQTLLELWPTLLKRAGLGGRNVCSKKYVEEEEEEEDQKNYQYLCALMQSASWWSNPQKDNGQGLFKKCAGQGHVRAMFRLGYQCMAQGDYFQSIHPYQKATQWSYPPAIYDLGRIWMDTQVLEEEKVLAVQMFWRSAELGYLFAIHQQAHCLEHGKGVQKDEKEAIRLYSIAVKEDDPYACLGLGSLLERRSHTRQYFSMVLSRVDDNLSSVDDNLSSVDDKFIFNLFQKAANANIAGAFVPLARCYEHGTGVSQNSQKATEFYQKAALSGRF